jgi:ATP-dependent Clp protease ATP-binding subunit ClpA
VAGLSAAARTAFALAVDEARSSGSAVTDREHLFIGVLRCEAVRELKLERMFGIGPSEHAALLAEADAFVALVRGGGLDPVSARRRMRNLWQEAFPQPAAFSGHRSRECRAIFAMAETRAGNEVRLVDLLWALVAAASHLIERCLAEASVDRLEFLLALTPDGAGPAPAPPAPGAPAPSPPEPPPGIAEKLGRSLTRLARDGKLTPAFGRDEEIKQVARVLMQAKKSSAVLLGTRASARPPSSRGWR